MQLDITGHQMDITDALRERVREMIGKLGDHTDHTIGNTHVVLEVVKQQHHCQITIHIGSDNYSAKDDSDNMYNAIDRTVEKIRRQMEKTKNRQKESRRH